MYKSCIKNKEKTFVLKTKLIHLDMCMRAKSRRIKTCSSIAPFKS